MTKISLEPEGYDSLENIIATTDAMENMDFCRYEILTERKRT